MLKTWLAAAAVATILSSAPALTQTAPTPPAPEDFLNQEKPGEWRVSKLPGVAIYGDNNVKVGSIVDVLVAHDGKAEYIVIGVGGFLGIGRKEVALPFAAVTFTDQPVRPAATGIAMPAPTPATATPGALTPVPGGLGGTPDPALPAVAVPPRVAYPDHGTIAMTRDQLRAAPGFKFAR